MSDSRIELLKLKEVMALTRCSKATVYRLISEGKFPKPISMGGRSVFWVRQHVEAHIDEQIKKVTEAA